MLVPSAFLIIEIANCENITHDESETYSEDGKRV